MMWTIAVKGIRQAEVSTNQLRVEDRASRKTRDRVGPQRADGEGQEAQRERTTRHGDLQEDRARGQEVWSSGRRKSLDEPEHDRPRKAGRSSRSPGKTLEVLGGGSNTMKEVT